MQSMQYGQPIARRHQTSGRPQPHNAAGGAFGAVAGDGSDDGDSYELKRTLEEACGVYVAADEGGTVWVDGDYDLDDSWFDDRYASYDDYAYRADPEEELGERIEDDWASYEAQDAAYSWGTWEDGWPLADEMRSLRAEDPMRADDFYGEYAPATADPELSWEDELAETGSDCEAFVLTAAQLENQERKHLVVRRRIAAKNVKRQHMQLLVQRARLDGLGGRNDFRLARLHQHYAGHDHAFPHAGRDESVFGYIDYDDDVRLRDEPRNVRRYGAAAADGQASAEPSGYAGCLGLKQIATKLRKLYSEWPSVFLGHLSVSKARMLLVYGSTVSDGPNGSDGLDFGDDWDHPVYDPYDELLHHVSDPNRDLAEEDRSSWWLPSGRYSAMEDMNF